MTFSCISRLTSSRTVFRTQTIASSTERLIVAALMSKHIDVDLISDALPFGRLWYAEPARLITIRFGSHSISGSRPNELGSVKQLRDQSGLLRSFPCKISLQLRPPDPRCLRFSP